MLFILLGFCVGTIGTLIGVGGGFMLIPILLIVFPHASNVWISSVSMWVVAMNATSGSVAYLQHKRVHLRAALAFVLASLPGSFLGTVVERMVNRQLFELIFGGAMILYAIVLFFKRTKREGKSQLDAQSKLTPDFYFKGCLISFGVGFIAAFFGIGGGVVHVPLLSNVLGFPVHLATGTSHSILALTAWFTTALHLYNGELDIYDPMIWQLGLSAVVGAQLGAHLSKRVSGVFILKALSVALFMVGVRLVWVSVLHVLGSAHYD